MKRGGSALLSADGSATAVRAVALFLVIIWVAALAARVGFGQAARNAWSGIRTYGQTLPGQPDARNQWCGRYYDALDALAHRSFGTKTTI
jgi:hypothetical protein